MSSFEEVQQLEIEAIESLYSFENEFVQLSHNTFQLNLKSSTTLDKTSTGLQKKVTLHISFPQTYPQTLPQWSLNALEGMSDEEEEELYRVVEKTMCENLNSPMIFTVAQTIQDFLCSPFQDTLSHSNCTIPKEALGSVEQNSESLDAQRKDNKEPSCLPSDTLESKIMCNASCRITEDQFLLWKKEFHERMIKKGIWSQKIKGNKLTGREIFERHALTLHNSLKTRLSEKDSNNPKPSTLWNNASLFADLDPNFLNEDNMFCDELENDESPVLQ